MQGIQDEIEDYDLLWQLIKHKAGVGSKYSQNFMHSLRKLNT